MVWTGRGLGEESVRWQNDGVMEIGGLGDGSQRVNWALY